MGFAVYHLEKHSGSGGGIGNHIDRTKGKEHTFRHADPERLKLNHFFSVAKDRQQLSLSEAVKDRIKEGYTSKRKIRADAVKYVTHILSGTHEDMKKIFENEELANKWLNKNLKFLNDEFGKENIVRFTLHMDEKTPHLHAVTVPITHDGRLSARDVLGNRKEFQARQDRYALEMKEFNLERGIKNTGVSHEKANEYYKRLAKENETQIKPVKGLLGVNSKKTIEKLVEALKTANVHLNEANNKLHGAKDYKSLQVFRENKHLNEVKQLQKNVDTLILAIKPESQELREQLYQQIYKDEIQRGNRENDRGFER